MTRQHAIRGNQKAYWGKGLIGAGLLALAAEVSIISRPLWDLIQRTHDGLLGVLPALGIYVLNATNAFAFHQLDYLWLASHILVLSCAMAAVIAGAALLRQKAKRTLVFELALAPEWEDQEIINNGSR